MSKIFIRLIPFSGIKKTCDEIKDMISKNDYYDGNYYSEDFIKGLQTALSMLKDNILESINNEDYKRFSKRTKTANDIIEEFKIKEFIKSLTIKEDE